MIDRGSTPDLLMSTLKGLNEDTRRWWKILKSEKLIGTGIHRQCMRLHGKGINELSYDYYYP